MPYTGEEKPVPAEYNYACRCGSKNVLFHKWESYDEAHEDIHYRCIDCGKQWWFEGIDS